MECAVPSCPNTTQTAPGKIFVTIPGQRDRRLKWCEAIGFNQAGRFYSKNLKVCEDHFDLAQDAANWMFYKTLGKNLFFRKGVLPHKNLMENRAGPESQMSEHEKNIRREALEKFERGPFAPELIMVKETPSLQTLLGLCDESLPEATDSDTTNESLHNGMDNHFPKHEFSQFVSESIFFNGGRAWWHRLAKKLFYCWENTPEKYSCGKCRFRSNLQVLLKQHTRNAHRWKFQSERRPSKIMYNLRTYRCTRCDFHTISAFRWLGHFRVHGNRNERRGSFEISNSEK